MAEIDKELRLQLNRLQPKGITIQVLGSCETEKSRVWLSFFKGDDIPITVERLYKNDCSGLAGDLAPLPTSATRMEVLMALDFSGLRIIDHGIWPKHLETFLPR